MPIFEDLIHSILEQKQKTEKKHRTHLEYKRANAYVST